LCDRLGNCSQRKSPFSLSAGPFLSIAWDFADFFPSFRRLFTNRSFERFALGVADSLRLAMRTRAKIPDILPPSLVEAGSGIAQVLFHLTKHATSYSASSEIVVNC